MTPKLWPPIFSEKEIPAFPCPRCTSGTMRLHKTGVRMLEGDHAQRHRAGPDFEPDNQEYRFTAFLQCDDNRCGEVASMAGDLVSVEHEDETYGGVLIDVLRPAAIVPAPPIIRAPPKTPKTVRAPLAVAFRLYWADPSSSANKLRASVEALLTDRGIPRYNKPKPGKKRAMLSLATRIDKYGLKLTGGTTGGKAPSQKVLLNALRWVGNAGSHEGAGVEHSLLLHAFEIHEHVLEVVYGKRTDSLEKIAKALVNSKGTKTV